MPDAVYVTRFGTSWHVTPGCIALDNARLNEGGHVLQIPTAEAADRRPCLVCADTDSTEWTVTPQNAGELWELIGPSKLHFGFSETTGHVEVDGLTVLEHDGLPRALARFGDAIRLDRNGRYTVTHAVLVQGGVR